MDSSHILRFALVYALFTFYFWIPKVTAVSGGGIFDTEFGANVPKKVVERITEHLSEFGGNHNIRPFEQIILSFGNTSRCKKILNMKDVSEPEAFRIVSSRRTEATNVCQNRTCMPCTLGPKPGTPGSCCNKTYNCYDDPLFGPICLPPYHWICSPKQHKRFAFEKEKKDIEFVTNTTTTTVVCANGNKLFSSDVASAGAAYAAYKVMELIGFAFMHPLAPTKPTALNFTTVLQINKTYIPSLRISWISYTHGANLMKFSTEFTHIWLKS